MQKPIYGLPCIKTVSIPPPQPPNSTPAATYITRVTDIMNNLKMNMKKDVALARLDTLKAEVEVVLTRTSTK